MWDSKQLFNYAILVTQVKRSLVVDEFSASCFGNLHITHGGSSMGYKDYIESDTLLQEFLQEFSELLVEVSDTDAQYLRTYTNTHSPVKREDVQALKVGAGVVVVDLQHTSTYVIPFENTTLEHIVHEAKEHIARLSGIRALLHTGVRDHGVTIAVDSRDVCDVFMNGFKYTVDCSSITALANSLRHNTAIGSFYSRFSLLDSDIGALVHKQVSSGAVEGWTFTKNKLCSCAYVMVYDQLRAVYLINDLYVGYNFDTGDLQRLFSKESLDTNVADALTKYFEDIRTDNIGTEMLRIMKLCGMQDAENKVREFLTDVGCGWG